MKRIIVTGALGHIGSRLTRELPAAFPRARIVMIDNLKTGSRASLAGLSARCELRAADVLTADLDALFAGTDAVVHLAALTDAEESRREPRLYARVNTTGAARVARACAKNGIPMIFPSTTSVRESLTPYATSKKEAEARLARTRGLRFAILRFGTIFGVSPGMRFHTAVNKFAWQASRGEPLTIWRTALRQKRPYLDLADAVEAIILVLKRGLFNGGTHEIVTINAAVRDIVACLREKVPGLAVRYVDSPIMSRRSYAVSCDLAGFRPRGDLRAGVCATLERLGCPR